MGRFAVGHGAHRQGGPTVSDAGSLKGQHTAPCTFPRCRSGTDHCRSACATRRPGTRESRFAGPRPLVEARCAGRACGQPADLADHRAGQCGGAWHGIGPSGLTVPLDRLHSACITLRLDNSADPPSDNGIQWSTWRSSYSLILIRHQVQIPRCSSNRRQDGTSVDEAGQRYVKPKDGFRLSHAASFGANKARRRPPTAMTTKAARIGSVTTAAVGTPFNNAPETPCARLSWHAA